MNLRNVYLSTLVPEIPSIINYNNTEIKRYLDLFYDEAGNVIVVPITTTGRVKGATGEFVNLIVDNLTVKRQYTNLYDNITTADYSWYKMYTDAATSPRDPCTYGIDTSVWNRPYEPQEYMVIDVQNPYYKIEADVSDVSLFLANGNVSQVVGIYFDPSSLGTAVDVLIDPCLGTLATVDSTTTYREFICVKYDASWGSTWMQYR